MKKKRLVSVVILQILLVVFMVIPLSALLFLFVAVARFGFQGTSIGRVLFVTTIAASLFLYCAYVFWLVVKRKPAARFLGMISILAFLVFKASRDFQPPIPGPIPYVPRLEYNDPATGYAAEWVSSVSFDLLLAWWAYRFAFSSKQKEYFVGKPASNEEMSYEQDRR